jgi:hypothetical protein
MHRIDARVYGRPTGRQYILCTVYMVKSNGPKNRCYYEKYSINVQITLPKPNR